MMSPEQRAEELRIVQMIQVDAADDARRREGQPFTGHVVAGALGEMAAMIERLALTCERLLEEGRP